MWKRKELKDKAKKVVYKNYWTAIVVCFLIALFTGEFGTSTVGIWQSEDSMDPNFVIHQVEEKKVSKEQEIDPFFTEKNIKQALNETQIKIIEAISFYCF